MSEPDPSTPPIKRRGAPVVERVLEVALAELLDSAQRCSALDFPIACDLFQSAKARRRPEDRPEAGGTMTGDDEPNTERKPGSTASPGLAGLPRRRRWVTGATVPGSVTARALACFSPGSGTSSVAPPLRYGWMFLKNDSSA